MGLIHGGGWASIFGRLKAVYTANTTVNAQELDKRTSKLAK